MFDVSHRRADDVIVIEAGVFPKERVLPQGAQVRPKHPRVKRCICVSAEPWTSRTGVLVACGMNQGSFVARRMAKKRLGVVEVKTWSVWYGLIAESERVITVLTEIVIEAHAKRCQVQEGRRRPRTWSYNRATYIKVKGDAESVGDP